MGRHKLKVITLAFALSTGATLSAQAPSEAEMQKMMEQMQQLQGQGGAGDAQLQKIMAQANAMQACMAEIDMDVLQGYEQESKALMSEVEALCADGKRAAALNRMMAFGQRMAASPEMQKMRECSAGMKDMLPPIMALAQQGESGAAEPAHVCDSL